MYRDGEGCNIDFKLALNYLKEGVSKGNENCYFHMAKLFAESKNFENMNKCFRKYFFSSTFIGNKQTNKVIHIDRIENLCEYLYIVHEESLSVDSEILEIAVTLRDEIYDYLEDRIDYHKKKGNVEMVEWYKGKKIIIFKFTR